MTPDSGLNTFELQISVARIEGMLTATLARHDQRLDQHEGTLNEHGMRLNDKGKLLARHDERIKDLEEDNSARQGKFYGSAGLIISIIVSAIAVFNFVRIGIPL